MTHATPAQATRIRPASPGDEAALALVGQATFLDTFAGVLTGSDIVAHCARSHAVGVYQGWLQSPDPRYGLWLVEAEPGGAAVGFSVVSPPDLPTVDTDGALELKRIYLLGRFQGGGVGRQLVDLAVLHAKQQGARRLLLGVYAHNHEALGFYARVGFRKIGIRTFTVGTTVCDDFILGLELEHWRHDRPGDETKAEVRDDHDSASRPVGHIGLGTLLADIARKSDGLTETEADHLARLRDTTPATPMRFE